MKGGQTKIINFGGGAFSAVTASNKKGYPVLLLEVAPKVSTSNGGGSTRGLRRLSLYFFRPDALP